MTSNIKEGDRVQSERGVGSKRGFPYYAFGLYEAKPRKSDGVLTWRLIDSGPWFRTDTHNRTAFDDVEIVNGVRNGTPAS